MTMIYIGSSNVSRFVEILHQEVQNSISVRKCTRFTVLSATMDALKETDGAVIISVIENFLCVAVGEINEKEEMEKAIGKTLEDFVRVVNETAKRLPKTRFAIVEPMERPAVEWYTKGLKEITTEYSKMLNRLEMANIMVVKRVDLPAQLFDEQKIHLTPASGKGFVGSTIFYAEKFFAADLVELDEVGIEVSPDDQDPNIIPVGENIEEKRKTLEQRLEEVEKNMVARQHNDSMVFARIREELDFLANVKKEDRVVVTGLSSTVAMPTGLDEGKRWVDEIVKAALNKIVQGSSDMIQFINSGRSFRGEVLV